MIESLEEIFDKEGNSELVFEILIMEGDSKIEKFRVGKEIDKLNHSSLEDLAFEYYLNYLDSEESYGFNYKIVEL